MKIIDISKCNEEVISYINELQNKYAELDKLNKELDKSNIYLSNTCDKYKMELEKLNNIINELEHDFESYELEYLQDTYQDSLADFIETELERIQELKVSK